MTEHDVRVRGAALREVEPWNQAFRLRAGGSRVREVETASPLTVGMTVVDWWQVTGRNHNALVMKDVDADGFFALLTERVGRL